MEAILATTAPSSVNEVFTGELNASNVVNSTPDIDSDIGIIDSDIGNNNNNNDTDTVGNDQESNSLINDMIDANNEDFPKMYKRKYPKFSVLSRAIEARL